MKKLTTAALLLTLSPLSMSDTILGVYAGVGSWGTGVDGEFGDDADPIQASELGIDDTNNTFLYVALEHPIPLIPNIRLAQTAVEFSGSSTVSRSFVLDQEEFSANSDVDTTVDLSHTDLTLYYEILDNWVSLDLGFTVRMLDGGATVTADPENPLAPTESESVDLKGPLPLGYVKAQFDLPFSGFYAGGALNVISFQGDSFTDLDLKLGWMYESVLDFGVEVGYRTMNLKVEEIDDFKVDATIDGLYFSAVAHF